MIDSGCQTRPMAEEIQSYPTMALRLSTRQLTPGGELAGELHLRGGAEPVTLDRVRARLWARVYSMFDDDDGAPMVKLVEEVIAEDVRLDAREEAVVGLRLPVALSAPVTLVDGMSGVSVILMLWADAAKPTGDVITHLEVGPLPWQERLLSFCEGLGLRFETTWASEGHQTLAHDSTRASKFRKVYLGWDVDGPSVTVTLSDNRRPYLSITTTQEEAMELSWHDRLSEWLEPLVKKPRKRR